MWAEIVALRADMLSRTANLAWLDHELPAAWIPNACGSGSPPWPRMISFDADGSDCPKAGPGTGSPAAGWAALQRT